jgi:hypothetical protein
MSVGIVRLQSKWHEGVSTISGNQRPAAFSEISSAIVHF